VKKRQYAIEKQRAANNDDFIERAKEGREETDAETEGRFARLRLARGKKTNRYVDKIYEDISVYHPNALRSNPDRRVWIESAIAPSICIAPLDESYIQSEP
jgi:hypothetical protein